MFIVRSLHLYRLSLLSLWHRLRHDFARELVVALCAVIVLATFGYIFNDFLNVKVAQLSSEMRASFARATAIFALILATAAAIRLTRMIRYDSNSLADSALRLGEDPRTVNLFTWLRSGSIVVVVYSVTWLIIHRYLVQWPTQTQILVQVGLLGVVGAAQFLPAPRAAHERVLAPMLPADWRGSRLRTLIKWRTAQIIRRNRLTQICLAAGLLINVLAGFLILRNAPDIAIIFVTMIAGMFASMAMAFQLQEDLNNAWAERCMGVAHDSIEKAYLLAGAMFGAMIGAIPFFAMVISSPDLEGLSLASKTFIVTIIPFFVMPSLMFQIDGRRPAIQAVLISITTVILSTAIMASWLALVLLPVFRYYVSGVQQGRFYRA